MENVKLEKKPNEIKKVLLVDDEEDLREIYALTVSNALPLEVKEAASGEEAISFLEKESVDLIVCDYRMKHGNGADVYHFLKRSQKKIPFVLWSSSPPQNYPEFKDEPLAGFIQKPHTLKEFIQMIRFLLWPGILPYLPVRIRTVLMLEKCSSDLFLRTNHSKFLRIYKKNDQIDPQRLLNYRKKGVTHLYLNTGDAHTFVEKLLERKQAKFPTTHQTFQLNIDDLELVYHFFQEVGLEPAMVSFVEASIREVVKDLDQNKTFWELLKDISFKNGHEYIPRHSAVLGHLVLGLSLSLGWVREKDPDSQKIVLAAFLHDIFLEDQHLARAQTREDLKRFGVEGEELAEYYLHPKKAADLVRKHFSSETAAQLIENHHERPWGDGFPRGIQEPQFELLWIAFVVGHWLVDYMDLVGKDWKIGAFLKAHRRELQMGRFQKVRDFLKK